MTTPKQIMKKLLVSTVAFTGLLAASLQAGRLLNTTGRAASAAAIWRRFLWWYRHGSDVYQNRGERTERLHKIIRVTLFRI